MHYDIAELGAQAVCWFCQFLVFVRYGPAMRVEKALCSRYEHMTLFLMHT